MYYMQSLVALTAYPIFKYIKYRQPYCTRRLTVSNTIDTNRIAAALSDGVLPSTLPKAPDAQPKERSRIKLNI
ncbi:MAG: Hsp20 family protein [bacterium]|nr:Hsp20 family protein [bacterium]